MNIFIENFALALILVAVLAILVTWAYMRSPTLGDKVRLTFTFILIVITTITVRIATETGIISLW